MDKYVEDFIENNIEDIQENNWESFFGKLISNEDRRIHAPLIFELINILDKANIDYLSDFTGLGIKNSDSLAEALHILSHITLDGNFENNFLAISPAYSRHFIRDWYIKTEDQLNAIARLAKKLGFKIYTVITNLIDVPNYILIEPTYRITTFLNDVSVSSIPKLQSIEKEDIEEVKSI